MTTRTDWQISPPPSSEAFSLAVQLGFSPVLASALARQGLVSLEQASAFLDPTRYHPAPAQELPDLSVAVELLECAVRDRRPVLIWGDFDVDGQTATALLSDALARLGVPVRYVIPDRVRESHGIALERLQKELVSERDGLLLTCDTGIAAFSAIDYAKSRGVSTIITDHHDLPPTLPAADAVINPKRLPPAHPLATLPGVGIAFKLIEGLYTALGDTDALPAFLDLVALGIVADVALQVHDTRYLLQRGLAVLRHAQRVGVCALCETAQLDPAQITADTISFQLGPRLNAAGRLADARSAVELLTTTDPARARILAAQLEGLNAQRRLITHQITAAAHELIERDPGLLEWEALVLAHPAWHPGIVGIVASQLVQHFQRPAVLLCIDEKQGVARGSARSVPGVDIGAAIAAQAEHLISFGGHPGAAGLALSVEQIPAFRRRLSETIRCTRGPVPPAVLVLDGQLSLTDLIPGFAAQIERLAPFGPGNPPLTFLVPDLVLASATALGRTREHRRLTVKDAGGCTRQVFWWDSADQPLPAGPFDLACQVSLSTYRGAQELAITLVDYRLTAPAPIALAAAGPTLIDRRDSADPAQTLAELRARYPEALVWAEGLRRAVSPGLTLWELGPAPVLIVYTTPPRPAALHEALRRVSPAIVCVLAVDPPLRTLPEVQRRLLELVKYVINQHQGRTTLEALAGAVAQPVAVIRSALAASAAHGDLCVSHTDTGEVLLAAGDGSAQPDEFAEWLAAFRAGLAESAAYRAFFRRAALSQLIGVSLPDGPVSRARPDDPD